jgi:hypothetical protein
MNDAPLLSVERIWKFASVRLQSLGLAVAVVPPDVLKSLVLVVQSMDCIC